MRARVQPLADGVGSDVEVMRVVVVEGSGHVLPQVVQRGIDVLLGRHQHAGRRRCEVEHRTEAVDGQQLGHVRALVGVLERGDLGQLAVLGGELRRRSDLDRLGLAERALGEGREPAQRFDLDVEEVDPHRALLGGRVEVEQAAAHGELPAVVDLLHAFVAGGHELIGQLVEIDEVTAGEAQAVRAQRRVGDLLRERDRAGDDHGGLLAAQQSVQRRHPQPDQVRRRREMRFIGDAARWVEADRAGVQPGPQVGGEVAGAAVVAGHHDHRLVRRGVRERRDQVRAQGRGDERASALARERGGGGIVGGVGEEGSQWHVGTQTDRAGRGRLDFHSRLGRAGE